VFVAVDPNSGVPVYRQIVDQIRFHIATGLLGSGDHIPSTRLLSEQLRVNPMTVSKAYGILEEEGLLEHRPGRPLIVARVHPGAIEHERQQQLRKLLEPVVTAVQQLGINAPQAVSTFREMLQHDSKATRAVKHNA
jgi:GntR family transcriptional regulator